MAVDCRAGQNGDLKLSCLLHLDLDQPCLQTQFKLTGFQNGVLPAAFMVGLLVASIVFSELCKSVNAFQLIGEP